MSKTVKVAAIKFSILSFLLLFLSACGSDSSSNLSTQVPAQGVRILGMDVKSVPSATYASAYNQAVTMGVREVSVSLDWALLEPSEGNYDNTLPDIIDTFYSLQNADLTLVLRPLDTPGPRLPSDLAGLPFNDPSVITAFDNFLTNLHARLPTLNASGKLKWIHVGNEIDANLGSDVTKWAQWQIFFNAAKTKIESLWGSGIEVSSIIQFSTLKNPGRLALYNNLLPTLDSAAITYYPLNADFTMQAVSVVASDFNLMVNAISNKPILLQECGYASSSVNGSSEQLQADFISAVFNAWDTQRARIKLIDFAWQYDVSEARVDQWVIDFGMSGQADENAFKQYLWTLGLSNYDASEKLALQRLRDELQARLWVQ
ncbi:hypothetical protein MNBD_GAMMA09-2749 [hydrothermal vent metagenome]|uniref:Glycoside hydrolase family 5 domain-containing protein n=1 Tax=hydrothermal vent metagenome TaxID=652676 RepID=A0A3B0XW03_9ZZZZ